VGSSVSQVLRWTSTYKSSDSPMAKCSENVPSGTQSASASSRSILSYKSLTVPPLFVPAVVTLTPE
jgi:hypothetical protein